MVDHDRHCACCGDDLVFFPSGGGATLDGKGMWECVRKGCELLGRLQPERDGESIVSFGRDGSVNVIQQGPTSQNEGNLPAIRERLMARLPERFRIELRNAREDGTDLTALCNKCGSNRGIQVSRAADSDLARESSRSVVSWNTRKPAEVLERLREVVDKKASQRPARDCAEQVLAIDASVDAMWTPILGGLDSTRGFLSGRGWYSVVLVDPVAVVVIDGANPENWCSCCCPTKAS